MRDSGLKIKKRRLKSRMHGHKFMKKKNFRMDEEDHKNSDDGKTRIQKIRVQDG